MPSITNWTRLEPRVRSETTLIASLQARICDPLWLLSRQWQFGEFHGEDAASPVKATFKLEQSQIELYCPGTPEKGRAIQYDNGIPLETLVECESVLRGDLVNPRLVAESGLQFFRLLGESMAVKYRAEFLKAYALESASVEARGPLDSASRRFLSLMGGRVLDGARLYRDLAPLAATDQALELPNQEPYNKIEEGDRQPLTQGIKRWLAWYTEFFREPHGNSAWVPERMEYKFAIAAPVTNASGGQDELVLTASEYCNGHLDWNSFEIDADPEHKLEVKGQLAGMDPFTVMPTPIRFRGMPAARWWEFEDGGVNFGGIETAPEDLARLLLAEFALIYGNDFFLIPIELPVGVVCRVQSLVIENTFGEKTIIQPASAVDLADSGAAASRMFCLSRLGKGAAAQDSSADFLFLPPALGWSLQSLPVEEVLLLRDEMANLAWAVERVIEGKAGGALNRFEAHQMERQLREQEDPNSTIHRTGSTVYRLVTGVPPYWLPLVPEYTGPEKRGMALHLRGRPLGQILSTPNPPLRINEEEVPREGVKVARAYQYARWLDGSTHLWVGRQKQTGRGERSSGLRFDVVEIGEVST